MSIEKSRMKEIGKEVNKILLSGNLADVLPIDVFGLLGAFSETIKYVPYNLYAKGYGLSSEQVGNFFGTEYGFASYDPLDDRYIIAYNDAHNLATVRWTLAHELGHIVLGHLADPNYTFRTHNRGGSIYEQEANFFAKCLLVPFQILDVFHKDYRVDTGVIMHVFDLNRAPAQYILNHYSKLQYYFKGDEIKHKFYMAALEHMDFFNYYDGMLYSDIFNFSNREMCSG